MKNVIEALVSAGYITTKDAGIRLGYSPNSGGGAGGHLPHKLKELGVRYIQSPLGDNGRMTHLWLKEDVEKIAELEDEKRAAPKQKPDPVGGTRNFGRLLNRVNTLEQLVDHLYAELGMSK